MKRLVSILYLTILFIQGSFLHSQDLQIQRGDKSMTFKKGYLLKVEMPGLIYPECKSCPNEFMIGRLVSYSNDTLQLRLKVHSIAAAEDGKEIGTKGLVYKDKMENEWPLMKIPSSYILSLTKQGKKHVQPQSAGDMAGGVCVFVGLYPLMAAVLAEGEENKDALIGTGVTMTAAGLAMMAVFQRKTYYINNPLNKKNKTWSIHRIE